MLQQADPYRQRIHKHRKNHQVGNRLKKLVELEILALPDKTLAMLMNEMCIRDRAYAMSVYITLYQKRLKEASNKNKPLVTRCV